MRRVAGLPGGAEHDAGSGRTLTARGRHAVRWICRGRESRWEETSGAVNFTPCDGEHHDFVTAMSPDFASEVFFIPDGDLRDCLASDGLQPGIALRHQLTRDDPILTSCMTRLARVTQAVQADGGLMRIGSWAGGHPRAN